MTAARRTRDADRQIRDEEQAATRAQARARLARERADRSDFDEDDQRTLADGYDSDAAEHDRAARESRDEAVRSTGPRSGAGLDADERDRRDTLRLQRTMLPDSLPVMPGVQLSASYRPADAIVGGDWYDAFRLRHDCLGFALGDVVGHGLEAATAAVELRLALRGAALDDPDPSFVGARLNDLANVRELISYSSLVYAVLDPGSRDLRWISFGHPPLLHRDAAGEVRELETTEALLATRPAGTSFTAQAANLAPGDLLLGFTDGLIERRAGTDLKRLARVKALMAEEPDGATLSASVLHDLVDGPTDDDIALLTVRLAEPE